MNNSRKFFFCLLLSAGLVARAGVVLGVDSTYDQVRDAFWNLVRFQEGHPTADETRQLDEIRTRLAALSTDSLPGGPAASWTTLLDDLRRRSNPAINPSAVPTETADTARQRSDRAQQAANAMAAVLYASGIQVGTLTPPASGPARARLEEMLRNWNPPPGTEKNLANFSNYLKGLLEGNADVGSPGRLIMDYIVVGGTSPTLPAAAPEVYSPPMPTPPAGANPPVPEAFLVSPNRNAAPVGGHYWDGIRIMKKSSGAAASDQEQGYRAEGGVVFWHNGRPPNNSGVHSDSSSNWYLFTAPDAGGNIRRLGAYSQLQIGTAFVENGGVRRIDLRQSLVTIQALTNPANPGSTQQVSAFRFVPGPTDTVEGVTLYRYVSPTGTHYVTQRVGNGPSATIRIVPHGAPAFNPPVTNGGGQPAPLPLGGGGVHPRGADPILASLNAVRIGGPDSRLYEYHGGNARYQGDTMYRLTNGNLISLSRNGNIVYQMGPGQTWQEIGRFSGDTWTATTYTASTDNPAPPGLADINAARTAILGSRTSRGWPPAYSAADVELLGRAGGSTVPQADRLAALERLLAADRTPAQTLAFTEALGKYFLMRTTNGSDRLARLAITEILDFLKDNPAQSSQVSRAFLQGLIISVVFEEVGPQYGNLRTLNAFIVSELNRVFPASAFPAGSRRLGLGALALAWQADIRNPALSGNGVPSRQREIPALLYRTINPFGAGEPNDWRSYIPVTTLSQRYDLGSRNLYADVSATGDLRNPIAYPNGTHTRALIASHATNFASLVSALNVDDADIPAFFQHYVANLPNPSDQGDAAIRAFLGPRIYDELSSGLRGKIGTRPATTAEPAPAATTLADRIRGVSLYADVDSSGDLRDPIGYPNGRHTLNYISSLASNFSSLVSSLSIPDADIPAFWRHYIDNIPNVSESNSASAMRTFLAPRVYDELSSTLRGKIGSRP